MYNSDTPNFRGVICNLPFKKYIKMEISDYLITKCINSKILILKLYVKYEFMDQ